MKLLWISLACLCCLTIIVLSISPIDTESLWLKWFVIVMLVFSSVRLVYYKTKLFLLRSIASVTLILIFAYWTMDLNLARVWNPKMVMYENRHIPNRTIELQTMATGEWPKKRFVDRVSLLPYIYWKDEIDEQTVLNLDTLTWKKVNKWIR